MIDPHGGGTPLEYQESTDALLPTPTATINHPVVVDASGRKRRPPILVMHGLMMSSEAWIAHPLTDHNIVFCLCDAGYCYCSISKSTDNCVRVRILLRYLLYL